MSNVTFTLRGLDTEVSLTEKVAYPEIPTPTAIQHHYVISQDVSASDLNYVFWFRTTNPELTSDQTDNDMEFATIPANWFKGGANGTAGNSVADVSYSVFVPEDGIFSASENPIQEDIAPYHSNVNGALKNIGVARVARQITGGYNNSDIFVNESELVQQYVTLDASVNRLLRDKLTSAGTFSAALSNAEQGNSNVTRELVNYCLGSDDADTVHRINDMLMDASGGRYDSYAEGVDGFSYPASHTTDISNTWVPFTFKTGDIIRFQLKYKVNDIVTNYQSAAVADSINGQLSQSGGIAVDLSGHNLGTNVVTDQMYLVEMRVKGNETGRS